jgi:CO dehydrogenase maturation factor
MATEIDKSLNEIPIISVCGKGGVGKTVFSALLSRVIIESEIKPLLLVDADPVGGLTSAVGEKATDTLAGVRTRFLVEARKGIKADLEQAADHLDYFILKALIERDGFSLLAMGHTEEKGCFCPANKLLRSALEVLISSFKCVLIDAEAGIEQINRDVTRNVNRIVVVIDASQRSIDTLLMIEKMVGAKNIAVVANRVSSEEEIFLPGKAKLYGVIPENEELKKFDREGTPLWKLPSDNDSMNAVRLIAKNLGFNKKLH